MKQPAVTERTNVLITVMTYPHPSQKYQELVCCAAITDKREWVRLYPVDYRCRATTQRFRKYQWVDIELGPRGAGNDTRKESRAPVLDSINILGEPLPAGDWVARRDVVDKLPVHTVKQLQALYDSEKVSLGIVRPKRILDVKIEKADGEWKPEWKTMFDQLPLFQEHQQKPLRKLPFKFSYVFECDDDTKTRSVMIEDWELGVLWLKEEERLGDERKAAESVRNKYLNELCSVSGTHASSWAPAFRTTLGLSLVFSIRQRCFNLRSLC